MGSRLGRIVRLLREHSGPSYKSRVRQLLEATDLAARGHLHPSEYFLYGLSLREVTRDRIGAYMSNRSHWQDHLPRLNDPAWFGLMDDKWLFHLHFQDVIPLPRFLGVYHPVAGVSRAGTRLCSPADLEELTGREGIGSMVLKPARGTHGAGVVVVPRIERRAHGVLWHTKEGETRSTSELLAETPALGRWSSPGFLLEECLSQHPDIDELAPFTVNTVRIVTLLRDADAVVLLACIRLGRAGSMVDNYSQGGYCAYVDPDTGIIGPAKRRDAPGAVLETRHVDNGVRFTGRAVPLWSEAVALCLRAARLTPGLRAVGWDVVITPAGPVIIEGNRDWGLMMWQAVGGGLLSHERAGWLRSLGVPAEPGLPPARPGRALSSLLGTWR